MFDTRQRYLSPAAGREFRTHSAPDIALAAVRSPCDAPAVGAQSRLSSSHQSWAGSSESVSDYSWSRQVRVYALESWEDEDQAQGQVNDVTFPSRSTRRRKTGKQERNDLYFKEILQPSNGSVDLQGAAQESEISDSTLVFVLVIFVLVGTALLVYNLVLDR